MPTVEPALTVKSLAEVAWLVSRVGRQMIETQTEPSSAALQTFWKSTRQLQRSWDEYLADNNVALPAGRAGFEEVATQLFTTELLARMWATILGAIDQRTGRQDLTRIAANSVDGLLQIRHRLLSHMLNQPSSSWTASLDRLRRRCDRWTDLLIGNLCGPDEFFQFAFDSDRARDFSEEAREADCNSRPVELLVAAGVRLSFLGQLPDVALESPAFESMIQSILGSIPEQAFHRDGSLRTQMLPAQDPPTANLQDSGEDVLLPGISLAGLRRRFS